MNASDILCRYFAASPCYRYLSIGIETLDVRTGKSQRDLPNIYSRHKLRCINGSVDTIQSAFDIEHYSASQSTRRRCSNAKDFKLSHLVESTDNRFCNSGSNIQNYNTCISQRLPPLPDRLRCRNENLFRLAGHLNRAHAKYQEPPMHCIELRH